MKALEVAKKLGKEAAIYVTDTSAGVSSTTPLFALLEKTVNQMTTEVSWNTRKNVAILMISGLGYGYTRLRDLSMYIFKVKPEKIRMHDRLYAGFFNLVASPLLYMSGGETDPKKIAVGTGMTIIVGLTVSGPLLGYSFEANRDFLKIEESKRLPGWVKELPRPVKVATVALAPFVSYALTQGIYAVTPSNLPEKQGSKAVAVQQSPAISDSLKGFTRIDSLEALAAHYSK